MFHLFTVVVMLRASYLVDRRPLEISRRVLSRPRDETKHLTAHINNQSEGATGTFSLRITAQNIIRSLPFSSGAAGFTLTRSTHTHTLTQRERERSRWRATCAPGARQRTHGPPDRWRDRARLRDVQLNRRSEMNLNALLLPKWVAIT